LYIGSSSACFELSNDAVYYSGREYRVILDGKVCGAARGENVFSLFGLRPAARYRVGTTLDGYSLEVETAAEAACLDVRAFGAAGDGVTNDRRALQAAIDCCPKNGRVLVAGGTFYTGPLVLKSHMTLEIRRDAKLLASADPGDYWIIPGEVDRTETIGADAWETGEADGTIADGCTSIDREPPRRAAGSKLQCASWEGEPRACYQSFLSAFHAQNICLTGEGTLDGNGINGGWYADCKTQKTSRPRLLFINGCKNVTVHGLNAVNAASWTYHPFFSKKVGFYNIRVYAEKDSPNTDGCNPESCDGVKIIGAVFSTGDDCVAVKSGKYYMGTTYQTPCKNITVRNCLMRLGHGGVVLGSEMSGGIQNLKVSQCLFSHTDRGLRIKTRRGRGRAVIDGVEFENIRMENVLTPLVLNMFYFCDSDGETEYVWSKERLPVDERTPRLGKIRFKNMVCVDCEYAAGFVYGLPEQPIEEVSIEHTCFLMKADAQAGFPAMMSFARECRKEGLHFTNVKRVRIKDVVFSGLSGDEMTTEQVGTVEYL
jgi:polygalacturonase